MPVLCDFIYPQGADFKIPRPYVVGYQISNHGSATTIYSGRDTLQEEHTYGGYKFRVELKSWVFDWDTRTIPINDLFENWYALAPGGTTPLHTGSALINYQFNPSYDNYDLVFSPIGVDACHYYYQRFPGAPSGYWNRQLNDGPIAPYWYFC